MFNAALLTLVLGIVLLLLGRRLFWIFVGVAGFLMGMELANRFVAGSDLTRLIIALVIGIAGALLAVLFYRVAVAIAGFFIGGHLTVQLVRSLDISMPSPMTWLPYILGGVIGLILILMLFDWALIFLSSLAGASLIVHAVPLQATMMTVAFIVLAILGILVQSGMFLRSRSAPG